MYFNFVRSILEIRLMASSSCAVLHILRERNVAKVLIDGLGLPVGT